MATQKFRFDGWVFDPESGDLERAGTRIRLQEQPALLLQLLIDHAGSVVAREQLISLLWPKGVVDFDTGLNTAIRKLRSALQDTADTPRYIETLPRRGYRFVASLDADPEPAPVASTPGNPTLPANAHGHADPTATPRVAPIQGPDGSQRIDDSAHSGGRRPVWAGIAALCVFAVILGGYGIWRARVAPVRTTVRVEAPPGTALPARVVAVLPFENLSADASDGFLASGIAESVLHSLAANKGLSVIARTSSFTFANSNVDAREIGRKLNARYLVEGSVQRAGDRLRVTAQLLDADSGRDLWSLRFDRQMGDIFQLQDEISSKVADALAVSLSAGPSEAIPRGTRKLEAYLAYIEGRSLLSSFKVADAQAGISRLHQATAIDPGFAAAYVEEARGLLQLHDLSQPDSRVDRAPIDALIDKALSLNPRLGEALVLRAWAQAGTQAVFDPKVEAQYREGLTLAPNYAEGYELYAEWLFGANRLEDALVAIDRARELDPLAPRNHYMKARILVTARSDRAQAEALYLEALRANPTYHPALARLGTLLSRRGNFADAAKYMERALSVDPRANWIRPRAARNYLDVGDVIAARDVIANQASQASMQTCILSFSGETPRAVELLRALAAQELRAQLQDQDCAANSIRDEAFKRRDYSYALHSLEVCATPDWVQSIDDVDAWVQMTCTIRYASVLMAAGKRDRATELLHALLTRMEGRERFTKAWEAKARAAVLALLGDTDGALTALEASFADSKNDLWYDFERAWEFQGMHRNPRFQALAMQVHDNAVKQAALLAAMRQAGEVPRRAAH